MHVTCPGCSSRYEMPARLLGPAGARVCCPSCWLSFVLGPAGELVSVIGRAGDQADGAASDGVHAEPQPPAATNGVAALDASRDGVPGGVAADADEEEWPEIDEADYGPLHGIDFLEAAPDAGPDAEFVAALGATLLAAAPEPAAAALAAPVAAPGAGALDADPEVADYPDAPHSPSLAALLDLDAPPGTLALAAADGRLFAAHGPALLAAFESLACGRPGVDVAQEFRAALRELTGLELNLDDHRTDL